MSRVRAFTLIELLIVVAIIAILAAIAVPNYLEAQTRAKVSRAKNDLRTVAISLETYRVDTNYYPPAASLTNPSVAMVADTTLSQFDALHRSILPLDLTRPQAYMSQLPQDIFPAKAIYGEHAKCPFHYLDRKSAETILPNMPPNTPFFSAVQASLFGQASSQVEWWAFSIGPDVENDVDETKADPQYSPQFAMDLYDPTNGSVSNGDIYYVQGRGPSGGKIH